MAGEYFMPDRKRYETARINEEVPLGYRWVLWQLIDELRSSGDVAPDYLQVFRLEHMKDGKDGPKLRIIHTQEVPEYRNEIVLPHAGIAINGKIFVVDDGENCTMMWAEEY